MRQLMYGYSCCLIQKLIKYNLHIRHWTCLPAMLTYKQMFKLAYICEYLLNKKTTKDISLVVFCINSHQIVYIYIYANQTDRILFIPKIYIL